MSNLTEFMDAAADASDLDRDSRKKLAKQASMMDTPGTVFSDPDGYANLDTMGLKGWVSHFDGLKKNSDELSNTATNPAALMLELVEIAQSFGDVDRAIAFEKSAIAFCRSDWLYVCPAPEPYARKWMATIELISGSFKIDEIKYSREIQQVIMKLMF